MSLRDCHYEIYIYPHCKILKFTLNKNNVKNVNVLNLEIELFVFWFFPLPALT